MLACFQFMMSLLPRCRPLSRRLQQRQYATGAAAQLATQEEEEEGVVAAGSLLEFDRGKEYLLGRAVKQTPQGWQVETARWACCKAINNEILPGTRTMGPAEFHQLASTSYVLPLFHHFPAAALCTL